MKIKSQFYLLVVGIVIIPFLVLIGIGTYLGEFPKHGEIKERFEEISHLRELAGLPALPIVVRILPVILISFITIFVIIMSVLIIRSIARSVSVLEGTTRRIADGELDLAIDVRGSNEITSLANSLNNMRNTLKEEEQRRYLFIMGITHDLKTPLALIKANVEAIEDGIADDPDEKKHSFKIINNKVDELEGMINSLLDFFKMGTGEIRKETSIVNLKTFLSAYVDRIIIDAELLHQKVDSNINLPDSLIVNMDSHLVQRALDNIVNNAFRYTPEGSCLFILAEIDDNNAKLTLADNGNGINTKDLPFIFDLFYRGSVTREDQGMGMGLAVAKSIIDSHGWSISVASEKDEGTSFVITIPLTGNNTG